MAFFLFSFKHLHFSCLNVFSSSKVVTGLQLHYFIYSVPIMGYFLTKHQTSYFCCDKWTADASISTITQYLINSRWLPLQSSEFTDLISSEKRSKSNSQSHNNKNNPKTRSSIKFSILTSTNEQNNASATLLTKIYSEIFESFRIRPWLLNRKSKHYAKVKQYWLQIGLFVAARARALASYYYVTRKRRKLGSGYQKISLLLPVKCQRPPGILT